MFNQELLTNDPLDDLATAKVILTKGNWGEEYTWQQIIDIINSGHAKTT